MMEPPSSPRRRTEASGLLHHCRRRAASVMGGIALISCSGKSPRLSANGSERSRCRAVQLEISLEEIADYGAEDLVPESRALLAQVLPSRRSFTALKPNERHNKQDKQDKMLLSGDCPAESSHYCCRLSCTYHPAPQRRWRRQQNSVTGAEREHLATSSSGAGSGS